jgi:hypothetical protein
MSPKGATRIYSPRYFAHDLAAENRAQQDAAKTLQIRHAIEIN